MPRAAAAALLGLCALLVAFWALCLARAPRVRAPLIAAAAGLPAATLLSAAAGLDPAAGLGVAAILAGVLVWSAAVLRFADTAGDVVVILRGVLASGALAALLAIVLVLARRPAALYTIGHGRAIGTFVLPGELAGYLIAYVPLALACALALRPLRTLAVTGLVTAAAAFALTFSRAGFIGMAAGLGAFVLLRRGGRGRRYAVAIFVAGVVLVGLVFNAHHDPSENFTRLSIWQTALRAIAAFPLTGVGPYGFARVYPFVRGPAAEPVALHAHSVLLSVAVETGLVGIAALAFVWLRFARTLRATLRPASPFGTVASGVVAGLVGTWVQGTIDTVTVVIVAIWLPFMALATASARLSSHPRDVPQRAATPRRVPARVAVPLVVLAVACAFVQIASLALLRDAAASVSFARLLPHGTGTRGYESIERVAPVPFVEAMLTDDALRRRDTAAARVHVARMPPGRERSEREARIAAATGRRDDATALYLDAGDDLALQREVDRRARAGDLRGARALEAQLRARLAADATRPNALADSWSRSARLAARAGDAAEADADAQRAVALAPLNTTYLRYAGRRALAHGDAPAARALFLRALAVDPADARAREGLSRANADP